MTLGDLRTDIYGDIGFPSSPPTEMANLIDRAINKAHRQILREPAFSRLRDTTEPITFASVASQHLYGLPAQLERVRAISERDTDRYLDAISINELRLIDPGFNATGPPDRFVIHGHRPLKYWPVNTGTGVWAASTDAADTTQSIQINGISTTGLASGDQSATLTGTSRVAIGSLTNYVDIQIVSLSAVAAGTVSLFDAAVAGNTLAQIPIGATTSQYLAIQLWPTPASAITYYVDGTWRIPLLDDAQDVPMLPEAFHDVLAAYARIRYYEKSGEQAKAVEAKDEYAVGLSRLKSSVNSHGVEQPVLGRPFRRRRSRLGGWFPADSW